MGLIAWFKNVTKINKIVKTLMIHKDLFEGCANRFKEIFAILKELKADIAELKSKVDVDKVKEVITECHQ